MRSIPQIDRAHPDSSRQLAEVIAEAFFDLAPSRWLVHDPEARRNIFTNYFMLSVELGLTAGAVYTTEDCQAAAIWLPVTRDARPELPGYGARLDAVTRAWADRFREFDATLDKHRPRQAHEWLAILAVAPRMQHQGIGTALLTGYHEALDREGMPAYLEASDECTRQFYLRHGYIDHGEPFCLPSGPCMYPMWREPHAVRKEVTADDRPATGPTART